MLSFFSFILVALVLAGGAYWYWRQKVDGELAEGAAIEWAHLQKHEPELLDGYDETSFAALYKRVNNPRFPGYALATLATFLVSLPITMALLTASVWAADKIGLLPAPVEVVRYVQLGEAQDGAKPWQCGVECQLYVAEAFSGFYFFFGVMVIWLLIVTFFTRRYHKRRPGYLRDEIMRERG